MTLDRLIAALVRSENDAADDTLLEALRLGSESEQAVVAGALLRRKKTRGLTGLIEQFPGLPEPLQASVLDNVNVLHHALREAGRSERAGRRLAAMQIIATLTMPAIRGRDPAHAAVIIIPGPSIAR